MRLGSMHFGNIRNLGDIRNLSDIGYLRDFGSFGDFRSFGSLRSFGSFCSLGRFNPRTSRRSRNDRGGSVCCVRRSIRRCSKRKR